MMKNKCLCREKRCKYRLYKWEWEGSQREKLSVSPVGGPSHLCHTLSTFTVWIPSPIFLIYKIIFYERLCILVRGTGFQPWLPAHGIQCYILFTTKCPLRLSVSSSSTLLTIYYLKAPRFLSQRHWTSVEDIIAPEIPLSNNSCLFHENMNHMIKLYLPPQANVLRLTSFFATFCLPVLL